MKKRKGCLRFFAWLVILALAAGFFWWGNNSIKTEEVAINVSSLPDALKDFRIVQISDLHGKTFGKDKKGLKQAVLEAEPDIIAITGDLVDASCTLDGVEEEIAELVSIAPVYYVMGNHEWACGYQDELVDIMGRCGAVVMHNTYCEIEKDGASFILGGLYDPNGPADAPPASDLMQRIREEHPDKPVVLLAHRNDPELYEGLGADLVLCGHGHGGAVRLPFVGGVIGADRSLFPEYDAGSFPLENGTMYVSRGLGGNDYEIRLFNRPHLPVLVLK